MNPQEPIANLRPGDAPGLVVGLATIAAMTYGAVILGLQAFHWLTLGVWHEVPLLTLFGAGPTNYPHLLAAWLPSHPISPTLSSWLHEPSAWLGLHRITYAILSTGGVGYVMLIGSWIGWFCFLALTDRSVGRGKHKVSSAAGGRR